jgi:hypothetical protein
VLAAAVAAVFAVQADAVAIPMQIFAMLKMVLAELRVLSAVMAVLVLTGVLEILVPLALI